MSARGRPRRFDRTAALRIAMELFWEHGYEGTSLNMLTSAMGITPTSLYAAFDSKEGLFREAVELYNSSDGSPTKNALDTAPTARQAIDAMLRDNADAYVDPRTPRGCMVVLAGTNLTPAHESIGHYLADLRQQDHAKVRTRLDHGVADGDLPLGTDTETLASYYLTVLHGLSIQARNGCSREQAHTIIDSAMLTWEPLTRNARGQAATGEGPP